MKCEREIMNEMIEKLKKKLSQFGFCSNEESKCFEEVGKGNCEILLSDGKWFKADARKFTPESSAFFIISKERASST